MSLSLLQEEDDTVSEAATPTLELNYIYPVLRVEIHI
jgi:hypothetical protein